jgi:hypothetical protein
VGVIFCTSGVNIYLEICTSGATSQPLYLHYHKIWRGFPDHTHENHPLCSSKTNHLLMTPLPAIDELFTFSPFGLSCRECENNVTIQIKERNIRDHVKKHKMDSRVLTIRPLYEILKRKVADAKAFGTIETYRSDDNNYMGYSCICGQNFHSRKGSAIRHCKKGGCDASKLQKVELIKLCCGSYVTQAQVTSFFMDYAPRITQQFDYQQARAILLPMLPAKEKQDHTYTHMYVPLIVGCGGGDHFTGKIRADFVLIHSPPASQSGESMLIRIHELAENWLLNFAQKNILMVAGNFRAALQTFKGGEVDDVSQRCTYRMQHDPTSLLSEL